MTTGDVIHEVVQRLRDVPAGDAGKKIADVLGDPTSVQSTPQGRFGEAEDRCRAGRLDIGHLGELRGDLRHQGTWRHRGEVGLYQQFTDGLRQHRTERGSEVEAAGAVRVSRLATDQRPPGR